MSASQCFTNQHTLFNSNQTIKSICFQSMCWAQRPPALRRVSSSLQNHTAGWGSATAHWQKATLQFEAGHNFYTLDGCMHRLPGGSSTNLSFTCTGRPLCNPQHTASALAGLALVAVQSAWRLPALQDSLCVRYLTRSSEQHPLATHDGCCSEERVEEPMQRHSPALHLLNKLSPGERTHHLRLECELTQDQYPLATGLGLRV